MGIGSGWNNYFQPERDQDLPPLCVLCVLCGQLRFSPRCRRSPKTLTASFSVKAGRSPDFTAEIKLAPLRRLHPAPAGLPLEIVVVLESLNRLRESPDYELCQISDPALAGPDMLEELAAERAALLAKESAELEGQAKRLAEEIRELDGAEGAILGER